MKKYFFVLIATFLVIPSFAFAVSTVPWLQTNLTDTFIKPNTVNGLVQGILTTASSTIGNGTQTGGLTVSGGATTTLNAYFASNVGIGNTNPTTPLYIGSATSITPDAGVTLARTLTGSGNGHGYNDSTDFSNNGASSSYNSYDARPIINTIGATSAHYAGFQARPTFSFPTTLASVRNFWALGELDGGGTVTDYYQFLSSVPTMTSGTIDDFYGYYAATAAGTSGINEAFGVYVQGDKSYFGGNVGISSTSPYAKLSITNTGTGPSLVVEDSTSPDTSPFIIDASGNVGIGTTTPASPLNVANSTGAQLLLTDTNATADTKHWFLESNGSDFYIGTTSDSFTTDTARPFTIETNGEVGIGTLIPIASLDVGRSTQDTRLFNVSGTQNSAVNNVPALDFAGVAVYTGGTNQTYFSMSPTLRPTTALSNLTGLSSVATLDDNSGTSANITNFNGLTVSPNFAAGYTGTVSSLRGLNLNFTYTAGSITDYLGILLNPTSVASSTAGIVIGDYASPVSNVSILTGTTVPPAGNWDLYLAADYPSILVATSTTFANDKLLFKSQRASIVNGSYLGGIGFFSDDTNLTAPGVKVAGIQSVAAGTHNAANQLTDLIFTTTNTGGTATNTEKVRITGAGRVGIGSTTPGTLLSLGDTGANTINLSETATSTFGSGINLRTGCFAINSVCITGGGGISSVTGTYPVVSSGGATPAISLAFGTTTSNTWAGTQTFNNTTTTNATTTGSQYLTSLATPAGTLVAVDPTGKFIATTTPGGGTSADYYNTGTTRAQNAPISIVEGDRVKMWYVATLSSGCTSANDIVMGFGYKLGTFAATTTAVTAGQGAASGDRCSVAGSAMFTATTTDTIAPAVFDAASDVGADFTSVMTTVN